MKRKGMLSSSSNPMFREQMLNRAGNNALDQEMVGHPSAARMTANGAVNKSFALGAILLATTLFSYNLANPMLLWVGAIGGLIAVLVASFRPQYSTWLAPVYAGLEGLFVGTISVIYANAFFPGIIFQAVTLTMAVFFMMLFLYKTGMVKVTQKFRSGVMMATGAIVLVYVISIVLSLFGIQMPYLHQGGMMGIGISLLIIGVASLNLLLDFDNFEKGEAAGVPDYYEWYFAMGLLVTIVWLYVEILRLLAIFSSSD